MKRVFFIDYENIGPRGLDKIEKLNIQDTVLLYFNKYYQDEKLADGVKEKMKKFAGVVESYELYAPDKNALDFVLCSHLGFMAGKYEAGQKFYIVSEDKGYRSAIGQVKQITPGIEIEQITSLGDIYKIELIREHIKELIKDVSSSKKIVGTVVEVFTQAKNLKDLHDYLGHKLPKDGEEIYNAVLPYYLELNPELKAYREAKEEAFRKKEEQNK